MKKFISIFIVLAILSCSISAFGASDEPSDINNVIVSQSDTVTTESAPASEDNVAVRINGKLISFDVPARIMNDRTMVPMRKIFETLGAKVQWIEETNQVLAFKGEKAIVLQIDAPVVLIKNFNNDTEERVELDVAPIIIDDRTLVPLRAVSEALDMNVEWEESTYTVYITNK